MNLVPGLSCIKHLKKSVSFLQSYVQSFPVLQGFSVLLSCCPLSSINCLPPSDPIVHSRKSFTMQVTTAEKSHSS